MTDLNVNPSEKDREEEQDLIIGRNAVLEAVRSGREIDTLFVAKGDRSGSIGMIIGKASENGMLTIFPYDFDSDGFFIARLRRKAD